MNIDAQSYEYSIQYPTQSTTSHEHKIVQIVGSTPENKEEDIFHIFSEIKRKNEELKLNTYTQFWKHYSSSRARLLSVFDSEKGKMQMAFLQAQVPQPRTVAQYHKHTYFEFNVKDVHPIDQIEMHKQIGQMIASTLINTAISLSNMQVTLANIQSQLNLEKVSSLAKDTKFQYLENIVLRMGYDPSNINVVEELIKKNNTEVVELKKRLKLPASEDPMAKEIKETETQNSDMMKLIIEQNLKKKKMRIIWRSW